MNVALASHLQSSWHFLMSRHAKGMLPHALLIVGQEGVGKREFSKAFARHVLCQHQNGCGTCRTCLLFACGNHPDFFVMGPEGHGQIKIDQIRELIERLSTTAQQGGYRVVIIHAAHALNSAAANALLKTLEEPGAHTLLMLLTDRETFIPATLRSRTQKLTLEGGEILPPLLEAYSSSERAMLFQKIRMLVEGKSSAIAIAKTLLDAPLDKTLTFFQVACAELIQVRLGFVHAADAHALSTRFSLQHLFTCYDFIVLMRQKVNLNLNLNAALMLENVLLKIREQPV